MNRLASEHSPYLLQHAGNPVDWYPWGEEAFEKARREDKPIFLSIGYSTCHWCHVMERESFEDARIAELLNRDFVSVKVDREERPDVDRVYMAFVQATTGSGGWPMSVWLTPDLKPFHGGTYFPPTSRWGRPGFVEVLGEIGRVWKDERDKVTQSAESIAERLRELGRAAAAAPVPGPEALVEGVAQFAAAYDRRRGGFGEAPKFPRAAELLFLLREFARTGDEGARDMALHTLRAMALGGMRDHIGGGFHRYAVDAEWRVPHFEKMLYDQAQLVPVYLEAAQTTGDRFYAEVAEDTLQYVRREMTGEAGGFFSAEDADSLPPEQAGETGAHKMEGAFYLWRDEEIASLLGDDADVVRARYGIEPQGNAPFDPQNEFRGKNLVYVARALPDVARLSGRSVDEVRDALDRARLILFKARLGRPRPHLDDKVLTAWNGLMIVAFARAARVLAGFDESGAVASEHLETARRAARFIRDRLWNPESATLLRRYRDEQAAIDGYAEDYAFLIAGLLELFQAGGDPEWLEWALTLQARQDELFGDPVDGGWFSTTGDDRSVLLRLKEDYDGAEPSATSVSVMSLLAIAHLTGKAEYLGAIERGFRFVGRRLGAQARAVPMMMAALSAHHAGIRQVVVVGRRDADDTRALLSAIATTYLPFSVVVPVEPGARQDRLAARLPWIGSMPMRDGRATAYVCREFVCEQPVMDVESLRALVTVPLHS